MNIEEKIQDWARKCGYTGPIPKQMSSFSNESTIHTWNDIITKVQPRNEIGEIRRKLFVHRLKSGLQLHEAMPKEYDSYHNLKTLNSFKEGALANIVEKERQLKKSQKLIGENKFELARCLASNKELEMKTFLLEEKTLPNSYANDLSKIQSIAAFVENSVFLNNSSNLNEHSISVALKDYVEKIKTESKLMETANSHEKKKVADLFHKHRNAVFKDILVSANRLLGDLGNMVNIFEGFPSASIPEEKYNYDDEMFALIAMCLEHEIEAKILDKSIDKQQILLQCVKDSYKSKLLSEMRSSSDIFSTMNILDEKANVIGVDTAKINLKNNIEDLKDFLSSHNENSNNLVKNKTELVKFNESINASTKNISIKAADIMQHLANIEIRKIQSKAALEVLLGINLDYLLIMDDKIVATEIEIFREYPLEYYKQYNIEENIHYGSNSHIFCLPYSSLLCKFNVTPTQTSRDVLSIICADLKWLTKLTETANSSSSLVLADVPISTSTKDFEYNSETVRKLIYDVMNAKEQMNILALRIQKQVCQDMLKSWVEMKFGTFISPDRLFDNQHFSYYESQFMRYYYML